MFFIKVPNFAFLTKTLSPLHDRSRLKQINMYFYLFTYVQKEKDRTHIF